MGHNGHQEDTLTAHAPRNVQGGYSASDFWTQWNLTTPRIALFVLVTPQSFWTGVTPLGFTSNTRDMTLPGHPGITFKSTPGISPTAVEQSLDEPTNLELTGIYQTSSFVRTDIIAGKWNFAEIEVFSSSWQNTSLGELLHFRGNIGEFKDFQSYFTAEGRGLISRLSNDTSHVTQRLCRVKDFRNAVCGHVAATVTIGGVAYNVSQTGVDGDPAISVEGIIFNTSTWAGNDPADTAALNLLGASYANGKVTAVDGPNAGISREISVAAEATGGHPYLAVFLKRAFPFVIDTTTEFNLVMGCTRTVEDCRKYSNIVNFRGEPYVPGIEAANRLNNVR